VAYAGTGRTPFNADSPVATAARILTQPPNLTGLPEPLRDLVAASLEKDPDHRPTATQLLDALVAVGAPDAAATQLATQAAQHGGFGSGAGVGAAAFGGSGGAAGFDAAGGGTGRPTSGVPAGYGGTGTGARRRSRGWRRGAPVLAAAGVVAIAAALFTLTPARDLLPTTGTPKPAGSVPGAVAAPGPVESASPAVSASAGIGPAPSVVASRKPTTAPKPADGGGVTVSASPKAKVRLCGNGDITVAISAQSDDITVVGPQKGLANVVNKSRTSCRVDGRAFFRLYNAADEQVDVSTRSVSEPGPAVDITLRPGGGAFEGIKWQACDRDDADCPTGNTIRGSLSSSSAGVVADLDGFPADEDSRITMSSLQFGTLQPSTEGVVAW
jgi:hypothetical protein